ncbi:MAG: leucyl/phenylalanyl-tRNA--protein transferase [Castellaniella sp.]|uniref:leucyl/phenylalanyl-tRNA--protein transferase n=1 Tax=Castellaniella sp. TaxID=1955812 RepID=UPI003C745E6C
MPIAWVEPDTPLPDISRTSPDGLVAAGRDLSPARLQEAYRKSLFPWYSPGEPVLWWSPDPRMILRCQDLRISRSLNKRIRQFGRDPADDTPSHTAAGSLCVTLNQAFSDVIAHCAHRGAPRISLGAARLGQYEAVPTDMHDATWITPDIMQVYAAWHRMGRVHSVETWIDGRLAGGLYGVSLGRCFFGESMFSLATDASKVALAYLVRYLQTQGVPWIDCQQETPHLASLGARPIPRAQFLDLLADGRDAPAPIWGRGRLLADGRLIADHTPPSG